MSELYALLESELITDAQLDALFRDRTSSVFDEQDIMLVMESEGVIVNELPETFEEDVKEENLVPESKSEELPEQEQSVSEEPIPDPNTTSITKPRKHRKTQKPDGCHVSQLVNDITKDTNETINESLLSELNGILAESWNDSVQSENMEYLFQLSERRVDVINLYFQFKIKEQALATSDPCIVLNIGELTLNVRYHKDNENFSWLVGSNHTRREEVLSTSTTQNVHAILFHIDNTLVTVKLVHELKTHPHSKTHHTYHLNKARPVDEAKVTINSLFHTIPVMFEGDEHSAEEFHRLRLNPKSLEKAKQFVHTAKGRKLQIGKLSTPIIPIQHNQAITLNTDQPEFNNMYEQLKGAGGFGFIYHCMIQAILNDTVITEDMCRLLTSYLETFSIRDGMFSRVEAIQITSLLLRYKNGTADLNFLPRSSKMYHLPMNISGEAILWKELLSESMYWEHHLKDFYLVVVAFNRSVPTPHSDTFLRLILEIVAKIIRKDTGDDTVCDIVSITLEMIKKWCSEPDKERTTLLMNFLMELHDFEMINPHLESFLWVEEHVLEKERFRQPILVLNGDEETDIEDEDDINVDLLQMDLPIGDYDSDDLFVTVPENSTRNRDNLTKGLLKHLYQLYVLCPDTLYVCLNSITAEKICFLLEVAKDGEIIALLVEMYESIINHNIQSEKNVKIFRHNLLLILARQLRGKELTEKAVNALFSIMLGEQVDVSAGLDTAHVEAFSPNGISCQAVAPLLTIFEESVTDVDITVFTVVCTSLNKIYINNNQLTQAMSEAGIDEKMTAVLLKLANMGDFRRRNEKLKALLDPWLAFSISIMRIGLNGRKNVFEGATRTVTNLLVLYIQENGKLLSDTENEAQRLKRDNIYWIICIVLLQLFKFLLDIALSDSNNHRSASNSSINMLGYDEDPEEIEATPAKPTKFWDNIAHKLIETILGPSENFLKCPYRKHKDTPLTAQEVRHRVKEVLTLCQYFFKVTTRVDSDEEDNLYKIFFDELSRWTLEEMWPNCIYVTADMMFVTSVYANCVAFVLTDIHQYILPYKRLFNRQKSSRLEYILQKILRYQMRIPTVFGNIMDIDQMIKLTMENITQRENHNSNLFRLAVMFLNGQSKEKRGSEYPRRMTPDFLQKLTVESEMASRYWADQRNEVIVDLKWGGQRHLDVVELNRNLDSLKKSLALPKNAKRIDEICKLLQKIEDNERVFTSLKAVKNNYIPRRITTILGPRGERMVTDLSHIKSTELFDAQQSMNTDQFGETCKTLSLNRFKRTGKLSSYLHGILHTSDMKTKPIIHVDQLGITCAFTCGARGGERRYLFSDISMIFPKPMRPWDNLEVAFQILLKNHEVILIYSQQKFEKLLNQFAYHLIANDAHLLAVTKQWEEGNTSNFEYLMFLNMFAGRTVHDSSTYPIFPRIIARFGDESIDLADKTIYRKLDRPVAAQDNLSVERHKQHYNELKENEAISHLTPYHFGSGCSNRGVVAFFNIRLLPFGEEAIELQDGRFDFPDRLFHTIESGLGMGKVESNNDYKELVPELFTTVEVLRNENGNKFGKKQCGDVVEDVELPKWCHVDGKPKHEYFIYLHRQALESEHVQSTLHHWIDLVFGYKSRGRAALDSTNVYHPAVYPGTSPPPGFDRLMTNAYEANQKTLGTAPQQLFTHAHPKREVVNHRVGSVRNMRNLAFGKELTIGEYDSGECADDRDTARGVWRKMKKLKSRIFNRNDPDPEYIQLFKRGRDKKEKDVSDFNVKINDKKLLVNDGSAGIEKEYPKKVIAVSAEDQYVACLIHQGPIVINKMIHKKSSRSRVSVDRVLRNQNKSFSLEHYGTILTQEGHYTSFELCVTFSTVFAIHKHCNQSVISVWDLHTQHIRASCSIDAIMVSCGVLKSYGELILVEQWTGNHVKYEKIWRAKEKPTKKRKYCGKKKLEHTEQILAKISVNAKIQLEKYSDRHLSVHSGVLSMPSEPGMGIQTLAMIRQDSAIVLIETLTLTVMRVIEVDIRTDFLLRELRYQEDNTLLAIFKQGRSLRKKNRELGIISQARTWYFKPK